MGKNLTCLTYVGDDIKYSLINLGIGRNEDAKDLCLAGLLFGVKHESRYIFGLNIGRTDVNLFSVYENFYDYLGNMFSGVGLNVGNAGNNMSAGVGLNVGNAGNNMYAGVGLNVGNARNNMTSIFGLNVGKTITMISDFGLNMGVAERYMTSIFGLNVGKTITMNSDFGLNVGVAKTQEAGLANISYNCEEQIALFNLDIGTKRTAQKGVINLSFGNGFSIYKNRSFVKKEFRKILKSKSDNANLDELVKPYKKYVSKGKIPLFVTTDYLKARAYRDEISDYLEKKEVLNPSIKRFKLFNS